MLQRHISPPPSNQPFIPPLLLDNDSNLTQQLPALIGLPPEVDLYRTLFPLVMVLLQDPVASVRRDSFKGVARLILTMHGYRARNKAASLG